MGVIVAIMIMMMIVTMMLMPVMTVIMMVMVMMVIVVMVMTVVVIMTMMMGVLVCRRIAVVGFERRRHRLWLESAFLQKERDLRHIGDAEPVGENLHRHMAVAEREDQPRTLGKILFTHLQHRLDVGDHLYQPAVVEQQEVVGAKQRRHREIELDARALAAEHEALLLDPVLVFEQHGIDDVALGFPGADDFLGARHGMIRFQ